MKNEYMALRKKTMIRQENWQDISSLQHLVTEPQALLCVSEAPAPVQPMQHVPSLLRPVPQHVPSLMQPLVPVQYLLLVLLLEGPVQQHPKQSIYSLLPVVSSPPPPFPV
ncbi:hypothetical protein BS17DRAFT_773671 [Gyrodon lividus]|nr:hypothetical protein BS17DRAFT_773671 [Gyrodon lividus]